jgi:hypothetical protein
MINLSLGLIKKPLIEKPLGKAYRDIPNSAWRLKKWDRN